MLRIGGSSQPPRRSPAPLEAELSSAPLEAELSTAVECGLTFEFLEKNERKPTLNPVFNAVSHAIVTEIRMPRLNSACCG